MSSSRLSKEQRLALKAKRDRVHERYVQKTYGLAPGQYQAMLDAQDGRCAICMRRAITRKLAVDHDHFTGQPRGALLCQRCNQYLGHWESDPIACHNLILYLHGIIRDLGGLPKPGLPEVQPVETERPKMVPLHHAEAILG